MTIIAEPHHFTKFGLQFELTESRESHEVVLIHRSGTRVYRESMDATEFLLSPSMSEAVVTMVGSIFERIKEIEIMEHQGRLGFGSVN